MNLKGIQGWLAILFYLTKKAARDSAGCRIGEDPASSVPEEIPWKTEAYAVRGADFSPRQQH
jgi:hypothetical protein